MTATDGRRGGFHGAERYLLPEATGAWVPARVAALIYRHTDLGRVRTELRGADAETDGVLMALHIAALKWRGSATGTDRAPAAEPVASSLWLSTSEAADLLEVTPRAVTKAIAAGRLPAQRHGRDWRISREDLEHYRTATAS